MADIGNHQYSRDYRVYFVVRYRHSKRNIVSINTTIYKHKVILYMTVLFTVPSTD